MMKNEERSYPIWQQEVPNLVIPGSCMRNARLTPDKPLMLRQMEGGLLIAKARMNTRELVDLLECLQNFEQELMDALEDVCGPCDGDCAEDCALQFHPDLCLPKELLKQAGFPEDAKLEAVADREEGVIIIQLSDPDDETSGPHPYPHVEKLLLRNGVCLLDLRTMLDEDEVIYEGE